jgi:hypothetical protein
MLKYNLYIDQMIAFENLTKEDAEKRAIELQRMIFAGIPTQYTSEQIKIVQANKP